MSTILGTAMVMAALTVIFRRQIAMLALLAALTAIFIPFAALWYLTAPIPVETFHVLSHVARVP